MSSPKTKEKQKSYHHGDLRTALIKAARDVLKEEGTNKLSLRAAARHAGVSHAAAYHHFKDKTSLLAAIAVEAFNELNAKRNKAYQQKNLTNLERVEKMGITYIKFALENPQEFRLMLLPEFRREDVLTDVEQAGRQGHVQMIELVTALQEEGSFISGNPESIVISMWATFHGLAILMLDGPLFRNTRTQKGIDALIESATAHLSYGLVK